VGRWPLRSNLASLEHNVYLLLLADFGVAALKKAKLVLLG